MNHTIHKVTCFITRTTKNDTELLLFNHPAVGVQIPAGTVNPSEDIESAARREAAEESGLDGLVLIRLLGEADDPPPPGQVFIAYPTPVFSRPDISSYDWAHFRTGLPVEVLRQKASFTQVRFEEMDHYIEPKYATYTIIGWVPDEATTNMRTRHFCLFSTPNTTPSRWSIATDNQIFELFWAPLNDLPAIIYPQEGWLRWLKA